MEDFYWHFGVREGGSDTADNIDAKFFIQDYASLVRESLQNSLDVQADESKPVVVTYRFGSLDITNDSKFFEVEKYIQGCLLLQPNPEGRVYKAYKPMLEYIQKVKQSGKLAFLEVSDKNTTGMDYIDDDEKCSESRFYSFAKSVGNSSKDNATRGGSYGLGKAVFYKNSSMRTILISSKTQDGDAVFEGVASLCTSKVDGKKHEATGYFCDNDQERPTTEENKIPEMFRRNECGTSIYIMGVDDNPIEQEDSYQKIKKAIASHFWLSILHKKLIVEVGEETIDDTNIIDIAGECFANSDEESPLPYIETVYYAENDDIPGYKMITKDDVPELGKCVLYIRKDRKGSDVVLNMRKTEMLIFSQQLLKGYGYYGIFICLGEQGNKILRMSEDPAHISWNSSNCEISDRQTARRAIASKNAFIKECILNEFGRQNENTSTISDLQNYLYMNVSEKDLETMRNSVYGIHSGEKQEENSEAKIPDLFPDNQPQQSDSQQEPINVFYVEENTSGEKEDDGSRVGGHGEGEGGNGISPVIPKPEDKYEPNDDGSEKGTFLRGVTLSAQALYTRKVDGVLYHFIRIVPAEDCANLVLDVYAIGDEEDTSDEIFIEEVMPGQLEGHNRIKQLSTKQGERLEVRIRFEDNMSHPVNIEAYEEVAK